MLKIKGLTALSLLLTLIVTVNCGGGGTPSTTLAGRVVNQDGQGVAGVDIVASGIPAGSPGCSGTITRDAVSGADGSFAISEVADVSGSGNVTINANLSSGDPRINSMLIFPTSVTKKITTGQYYGGIYFSAYSVYKVSGTILDASGTPVSDVPLSLHGTDLKTAISGGDGKFSFSQVLPGTQTITPSRSSFTFSPTQITTKVISDSSSNNFVGTYIPHNLTGRVTVGVTALVGVTISITGPQNLATTTDASGNYSFGSLKLGTYNVDFSQAGYASQSFSVDMLDRDQVQDFSVTPLSNTVYGLITGPNALGLSGVTVTASDGANSVTATTDSTGHYLLGPLPTLVAGSYTFTPSTSCATYIFTPPSRSVLIAGSNVSGADFSAVFSGPGTNSVGGVVSRAGIGVSGITVTTTGLDEISTITGFDGSYLLSGLHNGTTGISLPNTGYRFSPTSIDTMLCQQDQTGVNFTENVNWSRYGYTPNAQYAITRAGNNAITVGDRFSIIGLDAYGGTSWGMESSNGYSTAYAVTEATDGTYIVVGSTTTGSSDGYADGLVMKITSSGSVVWQTSFGGTGIDVAMAVSATNDGGCIVAGTSNVSMILMKFDAGGEVSWQKVYGGYLPLMVRVDTHGYSVAAGRGSVGNLLVMQVDTQGVVQSAQQFNETQPGMNAYALAATGTSDGGIVFSGNNVYSAWVMKVNSANVIEWQQTVSGDTAQREYGNAVIELPNGNIAVAGSHGLKPYYSNSFLLLLDAHGVAQRMTILGSAPILSRQVYGMTALSDGRIELTGGTYSWTATVNGDGTSTGCFNITVLPTTTSISTLEAISGSVIDTSIALPTRTGQMVTIPILQYTYNSCN